MANDTVYGIADTDEAEDYASPALPTDDVDNEVSLFDELKAEAAEEIEDFVTFPIEKRPGYSAKFTLSLDAREIQRYERSAKGKRKNSNSDPVIFSGLILVEKNTEILKNGQTVENPETGEPLTFSDEEFIQIYGKNLNAIEALQKFMGDGALISTGTALLNEAGYGDEVAPEDPTNG